MASVFISYSRRDLAFAQYLAEALTERDREVWVDWHNISAGEDWAEAIGEAVDAADAFVPVITPDWIDSPQAMRELERAIRHGKRILPVLRHEVDPESLPPQVFEIAWFRFREADDPEAALTNLLEALDTDPGWVRAHTRMLERAHEWERSLRDPAYLLRGSALEQAEDWLGRAAGQRPDVTVLQVDYVVASRDAFRDTRRRSARSIFVSYRREETKGYAGRLYDHLTALLGEKNVFIDVNSIRPGVDFVSALREALDRTGVVVALIGSQWLNVSTPDDRRRLDDPGDFVRLELETALSRRITVIPVLVAGATMPRADELPQTLAELPRLQAVALNHDTWRHDIGRLIDELPREVRRGGGRFRWLRGPRVWSAQHEGRGLRRG